MELMWILQSKVVKKCIRNFIYIYSPYAEMRNVLIKIYKNDPGKWQRPHIFNTLMATPVTSFIKEMVYKIMSGQHRDETNSFKICL